MGGSDAALEVVGIGRTVWHGQSLRRRGLGRRGGNIADASAAFVNGATDGVG